MALVSHQRYPYLIIYTGFQLCIESNSIWILLHIEHFLLSN